MITFEDLRRANKERLPQFRNRQGRLTHSMPDGYDWSIAEWTNALAGEAGEASNIGKKLLRHDYENSQEGIDELVKELADVVIYADLVAQRVGRRLDWAVIAKFNEVSERVGSEVKLSR